MLQTKELLVKDLHCLFNEFISVSSALNEKELPSLADKAMLTGLVSELSDDASALMNDSGDCLVWLSSPLQLCGGSLFLTYMYVRASQYLE